MDMQRPDFRIGHAVDELPPGFADTLIDALVRTVPAIAADAPNNPAECRETVRVMFTAMQPRNVTEAVLAAEAIAAFHAAMDMYARAAKPGTSDDKAIRLRNNALGGSRGFDTTLRLLRRQHVVPRQAASNATPTGPGNPEPSQRPPGGTRKQQSAAAPVPQTAFPETSRALANRAVAQSRPVVVLPTPEPTFAQGVRAQALSSVSRVLVFAMTPGHTR
jgi:hypothetical protein